MGQLHCRKTFKPVIPSDLDPAEKKKVLNSLMFSKEKRCGKAKARACADGRKQRVDEKKGENTSPTASTEAVTKTSATESKEGRDVQKLTCQMPSFKQNKKVQCT